VALNASATAIKRSKTYPIGRMAEGSVQRAELARVAQDTWRRGMFYVSAQYRDPWVLTVLIDRELWGGEGEIGKGANGHRDHAGPAFDDVCNCRAAIRTELVSGLVAAVGHALPRL
jgi:hypothetical protein